MTNSQIDKTGKRLYANPENAEAIADLNEWRKAHMQTMSDFYEALAPIAKKNEPNTLIAQRLKRLSTILDKIHRFPKMRLSAMQDIGGIRVILNSVNSVKRLHATILENIPKGFNLVGEKDYIESPKTDGYRGIRMVFKKDNLMVELQIRTFLEHTWSTAVESMSICLNQPLKYDRGDPDWQKFFALSSSIFARVEECPSTAAYENLDTGDLLAELSKLDKTIAALDVIEGFATMSSLSLRYAEKSKEKIFYSILSLDPEKHEINIYQYPKNDKEAALKMYESLEKIPGPHDQVLISVNQIRELKKAYPNYYLDLREFTVTLKIMLAESGGIG